MSSIDEIKDSALEDLKDRLRDGGADFIEDALAEIADSAIPVYTADLMEAAGDSEVFYRDDDDGIDLAGVISARIYSIVSEHLSAELQDALDEACPECPECGTRVPADELEANKRGVCDSCQDMLDEEEDEDEEDEDETDPENIYNLPGIRQSIEEDRR